MNEFDALTAKLSEYLIIKKKKVMTGTLAVSGFDLSLLRECMSSIGTVMEQNSEKQYLVTMVKPGTANRNTAYLVTQLVSSDQVRAVAYAKEGLISMHTAEKACDQMEEVFRKHSR